MYLTKDEIAFYDALEMNDSAVKVRYPADNFKGAGSHCTIDWTVRENVRAQMRVLVKRILRHRTSRGKLLRLC